MNNQMLIHSSVVTTVVQTLVAHGFTPADAQGAVPDVNARVLEAIEGKRAPQTVAGWQQLAARTAAAYAVNEHGKVARAPAMLRSGDGDASDEDDEVRELDPGDPMGRLVLCLFGDPSRPLDTGLQIGVLVGMLRAGEMPDGSRRILALLGEGAKVPQVARSLGVPAADVRARLRAMRTRFFRRLANEGLMEADGLEAALTEER